MDLSEAVLLHDILLEFGGRPDIRLWRNNSGLFWTRNGQRVRASVEGAPDLIGLMLPQGRFLGIECKSLTGRLSPVQKAFGEMIVRMGGLYCVARSVNDVEEYLRLENL